MGKPGICIEAIQALGKYGDTRAIQPLQEKQSSFYEANIRAAAFSALSNLQIRLGGALFEEPKCSACAKIIPALKSTIAGDIRASGGMVVGGAGLDETLYDGVICRNCGKIFCSDCQRLKIKNLVCPVCSNPVSPLFADYLRV